MSNILIYKSLKINLAILLIYLSYCYTYYSYNIYYFYCKGYCQKS